jgi:hypothetical protein
MGHDGAQSTGANEALECVRPKRLALLPPAVDARSVIFPPSQQQMHQPNLNRQRDDKQGTTSMFTDESAVYYPEELALLGRILDQVVQSLPPNLRTPYNRAALAQNILACASTGERDPEELRRAALMEPRVSVAA